MRCVHGMTASRPRRGHIRCESERIVVASLLLYPLLAKYVRSAISPHDVQEGVLEQRKSCNAMPNLCMDSMAKESDMCR